MLRLITMPDPKGRYWTLTVLGTPCATGHVADEDRAIGAAMNWCRVNGYTPRGLRVAARTGVAGGERVSYEAALLPQKPMPRASALGCEKPHADSCE